MLISSPGAARGALVFTHVDSQSEPAAKELLSESLLRSLSSRMAVVPCQEAMEDEIALLKLLRERDVRQESDAPERVRLLGKLGKYGCKLPEGAEPWAAWLTAYVDSRSGRREIALRMRNLDQAQAGPRFTSFAEPPDTRLSWSELVERCVQRSFGEELPQLDLEPTIRGRLLNPILLKAKTDLPVQSLEWKLYECVDRDWCEKFRTAVVEHDRCRRTRPAAECPDPEAAPENWGVERREVKWQANPPAVGVEVAGDYTLVASAKGGSVSGAQYLVVQPPPNAMRMFVGPALAQLALVALVSYYRIFYSDSTSYFGAGVDIGSRVGWPFPPLDAKAVIGPSFLMVFVPQNQISVEMSFAFGLGYEKGEEVKLGFGQLIRLSAVWRPKSLQPLSFYATAVAAGGTWSQPYLEIYGPLAGFGWEF